VSSGVDGPGAPGRSDRRAAAAEREKARSADERAAVKGVKPGRARFGMAPRLFAVPVSVYVAAAVVLVACIVIWLVLAGQSQVIG
jgi:hypothetical protein